MEKNGRITHKFIVRMLILGCTMLLALLGVFFAMQEKERGEIQITRKNGEISGVSFVLDQMHVEGVWGGDAINLYLPGFLQGDTCVVYDGETRLDSWQMENGKIYALENARVAICIGAAIPSLHISTGKGISYLQAEKENRDNVNVTLLSERGAIKAKHLMGEMHGHGNSTWAHIKKSFNLKLSEKADLLCRDGQEKQLKKYVLLSNALDDSQMRNKLMYDLGRQSGLAYTPSADWVDLYVDGSYEGLYLLSEKIDIAGGILADIGNLEEETEEQNGEDLSAYGPIVWPLSEDRICQGWNLPVEPAQLDGGYLLQIDYPVRFAGEASKWNSDAGECIVIKSPKYTSQGETLYIYDLVQNFENALMSPDGINDQNRDYLSYMDEESFVKRYIIDELSKNIDAGYSSYYFYKKAKDEKLYGGPIWDYDTAFGNNGNFGEEGNSLQDPEGFYVNTHGWSKALYEKEEFKTAVQKSFAEDFAGPIEAQLQEQIDTYAAEIAASYEMDKDRWKEAKSDVILQDEVDTLKTFYRERVEFLKKQWERR